MQNSGWVPGVVRLKWQVDKAGYEVMQFGEFNRRQRPLRGRELAGTILEGEGPDDEELVLVPRGGGVRSYDVALGEEDIYLDIVRGPPKETELAATTFMSKWGLLSQGSSYTSLSEFSLMRQRLCDLLDKEYRSKALAARNEGLQLGIADIEVSRPRPNEHPDVFWYVRHLKSFCWLEYLSFARGTANIQRCLHCSEYFRRLHVTGPPSIYCGSPCRQAAFRKRNRDSSKRVTSR